MTRIDQDSAGFLEGKRREINQVLCFGGPDENHGHTRRHDDFGPPWGFASLGDFYGQHIPGFWDRPDPRRKQG